ncbi:hypothetical protein GCM10010912_22920 [Paenibacillus albidus]|uniref:DUF3383 family protein n=1 Tax=Paenibacillus albidus TaxID=2041023 RepID=A0A917C862_9BACL|nr:DUF3383 family protein [Paenibacillus albidus]GGF77244.1 hypothetical protein GCM10010912_22920 [Paenibacillus albidus]
MSISDVTVTISVQKPTPILGGFGKPLILGASAAGKDFKNYADLDAVRADYAASTEEYKVAFALFAQENPPAEVAIVSRKTGTTPVTLEDMLPSLFLKDWHFLLTTSTAVADLIAIGDAVEANKTRQFFARTSSKEDLATIKAKGYVRTEVLYHTTVTNYPEASWVGAVGSLPPGSVTWKGWTLVGIAPMDIDTTELNAIHGLGANTYVTRAGTNVTSDGRAVSGEFIDFVHSQDYIVYSIQFAVQDLFNQAQAMKSKIPYDNRGIAQIESAVRTVLQRAFLNGMIAANENGVPLYNTTFPPRSQVDPAQIAARNYPDGQFDFVIAGAVHTAVIRGTIKFA